ncbi:MAG: four helix bundle protein [Bacteroidota bacterium]
MHNFRKLLIYQKSIKFTSAARRVMKKFPKEEMWALSSQFRRAADSIALNIAEGSGNESSKEAIKFLRYSIRSAYECLCCIDIAVENEYLKPSDSKTVEQFVDEIIKMLVALQKTISKKSNI